MPMPHMSNIQEIKFHRQRVLRQRQGTAESNAGRLLMPQLHGFQEVLARPNVLLHQRQIS